MDEVPNFNIGTGGFENDFPEETYTENDLLSWLFNDDNIELVEVNTTNAVPETQKERKRFKTVSPEELQELQDCRQSKSTKQNTKWGVKVFQGTCTCSINLLSKFRPGIEPGPLKKT